MHKQLLELTIQGIKRKKKTSLLIFLILLISFSFAISALSITESINVSNTDYRLDTYGAWAYAVYGGDRTDEKAYRKLQDTAQIGTAVCYGTVMPNAVYGTLDPALKEMGHLRLQDGRFPTQSDEIAIEADILNALGCSYVLGQSIRLQIALPAVPAGQTAETADAAQGNAVIVEKTYRLCGVICEYTDLWENGQGRLPGAVVTEEEALHVYTDAVKQYETAVLEAPECQYFFRATKNIRTLQKALLQHPFFAENSNGAGQRLVFNSAAFDTAQETGSYYFYLGMIFCVTLLAVFYVYMSQMEREVRHLALFRSIGITGKQLRIKLFYETLCFVVPAVLAGLLLSCGVIGVVLHSLKYIHTRKIRMAIPLWSIFGMALLWLAGVFLVRFLLFQVALRQPLRGRMQTDHRKKKLYRRLRKGLLLVLSTAVCATLVFTCMQSARPRMIRKCMEARYSYRFFSEETNSELSGQDFARKLAELPGIYSVHAWAALAVDLRLASDGQEAATDEENRMEMNLYGLSSADWNSLKVRIGNIMDQTTFRNGEVVILVIPKEKTETALSEIRPGDTLYLDFFENSETGSIASYYIPSKEKERVKTISVEVGAILEDEDGLYTKSSNLFTHLPYGILCPVQRLNEQLQDVETEQIELQFLNGGSCGGTQGEVYADTEADYYSTDYEIAKLCENYGYNMNTFREENTARIQQSVQTLTQLLASGGVILLVALLLIRSSLLLAAEGEWKQIAILRALGLSKGKLRLKILKETVGTAIISVCAAWGLFGLYLLYAAFRQKCYLLEYFEETHTWKEMLRWELEIYHNCGIGIRELLLVSLTGCLLVGITIYFAKRRLLHAQLSVQGQ